MSGVTLYGPALSTYVRTCRLAMAEKGVAYDLEEASAAPNSEAQFARHPFGKIPAFKHGDLMLFESLAICDYVDEAFDGPALSPSDPAGRALMNQWISAYIDYIYRPMVVEIVIQRLVVPMRGGQTDGARVAEGAETTARNLGILNQALDGRRYLAGDTASIADWFLLPAVSYLSMVPEGGLVADNANVASWHGRMQDRESYQAAGLAG